MTVHSNCSKKFKNWDALLVNGKPLQCSCWRIPGTGEPGGLPSMGSHKLDTTSDQQQQQHWYVYGFPPVYKIQGFPGGTSGKESACQCRRHKRCGFDPWVGKIPWRRKWQCTTIVLPGKFHGGRNLVGYSSWACRVGHIHCKQSKI